MSLYKPDNYNSLAPYLIVDDAHSLVELLKKVFDATEMRRFEDETGKISHIELKIDDSIIMMANSTVIYPAHRTMLHVYVPDVFKTFDKAVENGCEVIEQPENKPDDPDIRGSFYDSAGNYWAISTQQVSNS